MAAHNHRNDDSEEPFEERGEREAYERRREQRRDTGVFKLGPETQIQMGWKSYMAVGAVLIAATYAYAHFNNTLDATVKKVESHDIRLEATEKKVDSIAVDIREIRYHQERNANENAKKLDYLVNGRKGPAPLPDNVVEQKFDDSSSR